MRVLAHIHLYPPTHNAGAEWMIHALLRYGAEVRGWDVQVITDHLPKRNDSWQGIKVRHDRSPQNLMLEYMQADVCLTHLDTTRKAVQLGVRTSTPVVHLVHNHRQLAFHQVKPNQAPLVIFNSEWLRDEVAWDGPSTILHPPTRVADYEIDPRPDGDMVTLLNVQAAKGSDTFYELARRNPTIPFLGVKGSYGLQEMPPTDLANVVVIDNQADVKKVYEMTRVLLMPSHYESWGRVAVEAACSGIPSICAPTPGLKEANVAYAFADPEDYAAWDSALGMLYGNDDEWERASVAAKKRAIELDGLVDIQLRETAEAIEAL